jgi:hypothetical protein
MSTAPRIQGLKLLSLHMAKTSLESARESCRLAGDTKSLRKIESALKAVSGSINKAESPRRAREDLLTRARRLTGAYPVPTGQPPAPACGGSEEEPVDGWCLIEIWDDAYVIEADYNCQRTDIPDDEAAFRYVLEQAERTREQRYIDALRWHLRDAEEIARRR